MSKNYWKRLSSGKYVDLGNLSIDDIDLSDINTSLNNYKRFGGHYKDKPPLTVAQHTLLCMNISDMIFADEEVKLACLLHDWPEAYYGDIITPIKHMSKDYRKITDPIDKLVWEKYWPNGKGPSDTVKQACKACDLISMDIERRAMWKSQLGKEKWPPSPRTNLSLMDKEAMFEEVANQKFVNLEELYNGSIS